jgi:putative transposase
MPSRLKRYQLTGDFHFLTLSCHDRCPYFASAAARDRFEHALEQTRRRCIFHVFGYVVMPEHVHLLVSEPKRATLARAIQALKTAVSKQSRQRPFWQVRYYDFNVFTSAKRTEKLRYMHRNPVVRGLVARPEHWKWSSFRHYLTGESGIVEIESTWTAGKRTGLKLPEHTLPVGARSSRGICLSR